MGRSIARGLGMPNYQPGIVDANGGTAQTTQGAEVGECVVCCIGIA
jgi:hypothetical protein